MPDEHIKFWDKFEQQGEDAVRQNLNLGSYGGRKRQYAIAWLEENRQRVASGLELEALDQAGPGSLVGEGRADPGELTERVQGRLAGRTEPGHAGPARLVAARADAGG